MKRNLNELHLHRRAKSLVKHLHSYMKRAGRPSAATLDRLALLAGFQSWKDLDNAIHGEGKDVLGDA